MADISHLIRLFDLDSGDTQWRLDLSTRVRTQIALLQEEHRDYKRRAEAAETRAEAAEADVIETGKAYAAKAYVVAELQRINGELLDERDAALRQLEQAQARIAELEAERVQLVVNSIRGGP